MIMASPGFFLSLVHVLLLIITQSTATSQKIASNANNSGVSKTDSKCHNVYTSKNFYAGPNKKIEALLHEVREELGEIREEIKYLKGNNTIGKGPSRNIEALLYEVKKEIVDVREEINSFRENKTGSNKKIEILLPEVKKELTQMREALKYLKENRTLATGPSKKIEGLLQEVKKQLGEVQMEIKPLKENKMIAGSNRTIRALLLEVEKELSKMRDKTNCLKENRMINKVYKNCAEAYKSGKRLSGVYTIDPENGGAFDVFCDQTTAGGGWTVFQKRQDGSVDFRRGWDDYKRGFGNLNGEFWLGLDKIHRLTKQKRRLRVELEDTNGKTAYAEYSFFGVANEGSQYKLSLGTYSGTAGDSLSYHGGSAFSTKDRDNDNRSDFHCAKYCKAGWWFNKCLDSNLNGLYHHGKHSTYFDGVNWGKWKGAYYSLKRAEMKIKPVN